LVLKQSEELLYLFEKMLQARDKMSLKLDVNVNALVCCFVKVIYSLVIKTRWLQIVVSAKQL